VAFFSLLSALAAALAGRLLLFLSNKLVCPNFFTASAEKNNELADKE